MENEKENAYMKSGYNLQKKFFHKLNMFAVVNCESKFCSNFFRKQFPPFKVVNISIIVIMKSC